MRKLTFAQACAQFTNRYTAEHVPAWARKAAPNNLFYAPQYASDREWYENTKFHGEPGHFGRRNECYTTGQTWPFGKWLKAPYTVNGRVLRADEATECSKLEAKSGADIGYLQHGAAPGPMRTERVTVKEAGWPRVGQWLAHFEGRWRLVHVQVKRTFIIHMGQRITIQIDGV